MAYQMQLSKVIASVFPDLSGGRTGEKGEPSQMGGENNIRAP